MRALAAIPIALASRGAANGETTLRVGTVAADSYAEPYYAVAAGFFSKAGLTAQVTTFPNGAAVAAACAGGAVDVGVTDIVPIANAVERGVPFAIIAPCGLYESDDSVTYLCVGKNTPYKSAKDLEGRTVAVVSLVSLSSVAVRQWLVRNGADLGTIRFVELPFPAMAPALTRGTVAAAFLSEPFLSDAGDTVRIVASPYDAIASRFAISEWFTTKRWISENTRIARALIATIYETARWANAHHDQSAEILAKYSKLELGRIRSMRRAPYGTALTPSLVQPVLDAAVRYKAVAKALDAGTLIVTP